MIIMMRRWMMAAVAVVLSGVAHAERLPIFPKRTPYADARESLLILGWKPIHLPDADKCAEDDGRCKGRPEMRSCSGTGLARCVFMWRKNDALIEVDTYGEEDPIVDGVTCRVNCSAAPAQKLSTPRVPWQQDDALNSPNTPLAIRAPGADT